MDVHLAKFIADLQLRQEDVFTVPQPVTQAASVCTVQPHSTALKLPMLLPEVQSKHDSNSTGSTVLQAQPDLEDSAVSGGELVAVHCRASSAFAGGSLCSVWRQVSNSSFQSIMFVMPEVSVVCGDELIAFHFKKCLVVMLPSLCQLGRFVLR